MQAVGLIVEYNPFHNGHQWHVQQAKKRSGCSAAVGVMSGNFVQRGEPAILDKWTRAEMAIQGGVDLVLELPVMFAVRSAQFFAAGAVRLLNSLGVVEKICFGAENANQAQFEKITMAREHPQFNTALRRQLRAGSPYAAALGRTIEKSCGVDSAVVSSPNNILAFEYLLAIRKYAPNLLPIMIDRHQSGYHDQEITSPFASAAAIRQALLANGPAGNKKLQAALPKTSFELILSRLKEQRGPVTIDLFSQMALYKLRSLSPEDLRRLPDVSEGLENRIRDCALQAGNIQEFYYLLKSRRYTMTRLQRSVIHVLLGLTKTDAGLADKNGPLYARVLAFNQQGRHILKALNDTASIPIINKTAAFLTSKQLRGCRESLPPLQRMLAADIFASDVYALGLPTARWAAGGWDFRHSPRYIPSLPAQSNV
ncbi:MAG: nucleotidyltransferase [Veillonellales bacterium]